jgi:hypothetical protein
MSGGIGPAFLVPNPDMLASVLAYPGLVGDSPDTSRLYTKGPHHGASWLDGTEAARVAQWIIDLNAAEHMNAGPPAPHIEPFVPIIGTNTVDLSKLDAQLMGQMIVFNAGIIGGDGALSMIELSMIEIVTPVASGLHIVHPLWSRWDDSGRAFPDPVDSFSNLDQTTRSSTIALLGPGLVILPSYASGQRINVVFEKIEAIAD